MDWVGTSKPKKCHEGVPGFSGGSFSYHLTLSAGAGAGLSPNTQSQCQLLRKCCNAPSKAQVKHQRGTGEDRKCFFWYKATRVITGAPGVNPGKVSLESKRHYQQIITPEIVSLEEKCSYLIDSSTYSSPKQQKPHFRSVLSSEP